MTKQKKIFWICIFVVVALLISYGVAMVFAAIHRGEEQESFGEVPLRELSYQNDEIDLKNFQCSVYKLVNHNKAEKTIKAEKAVELYNLIDLASWQGYSKAIDSSVEEAEDGFCLVFCMKDESKAENCYGCLYVFDNDTSVYSTYSADPNISTHKMPKGKYQEIIDFVLDN